MDGDATAKTLDRGANSAMNNSEFSGGIHETSTQASAPVGEKTTGTGTSMFDKDGAIGKQFKADGAIGGTAQAIGGPFDKEGAIGKHFNADGKIGGAVQENVAKPDTQ